jgi:hypothetical protein
MAPAPSAVTVTIVDPSTVFVEVNGSAEDHQAQARTRHAAGWTDWRILYGHTLAGALSFEATLEAILAAGDTVEVRVRGLTEPGVVGDAGSSPWVAGSATL